MVLIRTTKRETIRGIYVIMRVLLQIIKILRYKIYKICAGEIVLKTQLSNK